ncbi:toprim domain-containing protein [Kiloniella sp. b19]|uniref:toprim domain-containing protein n=1 Tax=Kiloniella sp. GXU_MW_B19 TaxID=3141326 RepID=UPI0031D99736
MAIRDDIRADLKKRLISDYQFKDRGEWLQGGTCPSCGKRELFTNAENPAFLRCNRQNRCGYEENTRNLYPDLFENLNKRYEPTPEAPNATADAYMDFVRGLPLKDIKGWYRQEKFWSQRDNVGTATVRFDLNRENNIFMERFVETITVTDQDGVKVKRKQHFGGSHKGMAWAPPGFKIEPGRELWIVEGIIDAIALNLSGKPTIAILSCGNYPDQWLKDKKVPFNVTLVWALDDDPAGRKFAKRHAAKAFKEGYTSKAAFCPNRGKEKIDWNEAYKAGDLKQSRFFEQCRFEGDLHFAANATDRGFIIWQAKGFNGFSFEFNNKIYWWQLDGERFNKEVDAFIKNNEGRGPDHEERDKIGRRCGAIEEISNCRFEFLYFLQSRFTDESWYYAKITMPMGGRVFKDTFTGGQIAASSEFKKRLLTIAPGALFSGKGHHLDHIIRTDLNDIKTVETVDFVGYAKEYGAWIFNDQAIKEGKAFTLNEEDFFELGKSSVKTQNKSVALTLGEAKAYNPEWVKDLWQAFGPEGIAALTFFFGSLFAEQIRSMHKSFPFLEIVGEAGAGKSTLIEFLWKLLGRNDYEGFDPNKETVASRARKFSQGANLPVCLIESDREDVAKVKQYDWDELKTAYNGRSHRGRGVKNSGNDTDDQPFRGSIVITQNNPVNASEAILQRIVHFFFTTKSQTKESYHAAKRLEQLTVEELSYFIVKACTAEKAVLETVKKETAIYETELLKTKDVKSNRIAKNHAQMMACLSALQPIAGLTDEMVDRTILAFDQAAKERQHAIEADHEVVARFWEVYEYFLANEKRANHSNRDDQIAINLSEFEKWSYELHQSIPTLEALKKHLKNSKTRKFIDTKVVSSSVLSKSIRCWVFQTPKGGQHQ